MQKYNAVVIFTTGAPGTGKTYSRCARFLWDYWLPNEKGVHWSNFPVVIEKFLTKYPDAEKRIKIIPKDVLDSWAAGESGPWDYFHDKDISGAHIAIDEIHNYMRKTGKGVVALTRKWELWLGEIRHRGCTVEFLSQDPQKVNKCVEQHAAVRILLVNSDDRRDPLFGILLGDIYQLKAAFVGEYETTIWQSEERRINGKWVRADMSRFTLEPRYFVLYDSFNTPQSGGVKANGKQYEFQKRGRVGCVRWFLWRNWWRLLTRFALVAVVLWFLIGGGIPATILYFNKWVKGRVAQKEPVNKIKPAVPVDQVPRPPAGAESHRQKKSPSPIAQTADVNNLQNRTVPEAVPVRSENVARASTAPVLSGVEQQELVPRLSYLTPDLAGLDDGQSIRIGDCVGEYWLLSIDWGTRCATFEKRGESDAWGKYLRVPVGGPVGERLRKKDGTAGGGIGAVQESVSTSERASPPVEKRPRASNQNSAAKREGNAAP